MKILQVAFNATLDAAALVTIAVNSVVIRNDDFTVEVEQEAEGNTAGTIIGGDNTPVIEVQPKYFGKSVAGVRCSAIVYDLSWMRSNMSAYEYFKLYTDANRGDAYLVSGVMNVTTDQAYDPFDSTQASGTPPTNYALFSGLDGEMFPG